MNEQNMMSGSNYLRGRIDNLKKTKETIKLRKADEQQNARVSEWLNLYEAWFNTQNPELKKKYDVASRWAELAWMIVDYWKSKGITISWTDAEVIDTYLKGSPEKSKMLYDFTHSDMDPEEFAISMWWMKAPDPTIEDNASQFWSDVVGGFYDAATSLPRMGAKGVANAIGRVAKQFGADDARVDQLVQNYKNYIDSDWSSKEIGANEDNAAYKVSRFLWDMGVVAAGEWAVSAWVKAAAWGPLVTKATPTAYKAAVWALEWAWDMTLYELQAENRLPTWGEVALWAWLWVAAPMLWAAGRGIKNATKKRAVTFAERILQNTNRMTKWEQATFFKRYNQTVWKWLNDRWLKSGEDIVEYFTRSKNKVDNALSAINWRFTSKELDNVLDDVVDFARDTKNPMAWRMEDLYKKNLEGWLEMSEINEVKRFFEAHNKFNYLTKWTAKQSELATNMDSALREWQYKIAEQNWLGNLAELNKETAAAKQLMDWTKKWEAWTMWNNPISLSDVIVALWWGVSPEKLATYIMKKERESPAVRSKLVDMLNWIWWHETMSEKVADLTKIMEANSEKEINRLYKEWWVGNATPKLEYKGMEQATNNPNFTELRDYTRPKPVKETDVSKNNPWLVEKEVIENVPTVPKKKDARLDFWTEGEWLSKLRSKNWDYMIVSAENFKWLEQSPWVNSKSTKAFREFLDEQGIAWEPQLWMYWNPERSQIIAIDNPEQRAIIDKWIKENAEQAENIIVKNWKAYRYDPATNEAYYVDLKKANLDLPADVTNYYSEINGKKYQLPLYSEAEKPISVEDFLSVYNS